MTREDLHSRFGDELRGLLLESFAQNEKTVGDMHTKGLQMRQQMTRAKGLLDRIFEAMEPQKPPLGNGSLLPKQEVAKR